MRVGPVLQAQLVPGHEDLGAGLLRGLGRVQAAAVGEYPQCQFVVAGAPDVQRGPFGGVLLAAVLGEGEPVDQAVDLVEPAAGADCLQLQVVADAHDFRAGARGLGQQHG